MTQERWCLNRMCEWQKALPDLSEKLINPKAHRQSAFRMKNALSPISHYKQLAQGHKMWLAENEVDCKRASVSCACFCTMLYFFTLDLVLCPWQVGCLISLPQTESTVLHSNERFPDMCQIAHLADGKMHQKTYPTGTGSYPPKQDQPQKEPVCAPAFILLVFPNH